MVKCSHIKENGLRCQAQAMTNKDYCFLHSQETEMIEKRLEAQSKGGQNGKKYIDEPSKHEIKIENMADVIRLLSDTVNMVRINKMNPKKANCIGYLLNVALKAIEKKDLEIRIECLESVIGNR